MLYELDRKCCYSDLGLLVCLHHYYNFLLNPEIELKVSYLNMCINVNQKKCKL